jgi:glycyl-tRNA synthetase alpha chain
VRTLSRLVAQAYYESREKLGFPMLPKSAGADVDAAEVKVA